MQAKAAVEYWIEGARAHSMRASQAMSWFVITGMFAIAGVILTAYGLHRSGMIVRGSFDFVTAAVLPSPPRTSPDIVPPLTVTVLPLAVPLLEDPPLMF